MASSTARNCLRSSSRRVVFFEFANDEFDLLELFPASTDLPSIGGGERFFEASANKKFKRLINFHEKLNLLKYFCLPFLLLDFRSLTILSRDRDVL